MGAIVRTAVTTIIEIAIVLLVLWLALPYVSRWLVDAGWIERSAVQPAEPAPAEQRRAP